MSFSVAVRREADPSRDKEGKRVYHYERLPTPIVRQYTVFNTEQGRRGPGSAHSQC